MGSPEYSYVPPGQVRVEEVLVNRSVRAVGEVNGSLVLVLCLSRVEDPTVAMEILSRVDGARIPPPEPKVLIYSGGQDIPTLDPRDRGDYTINNMMRAVYDSLWWQEGWPPKLTPGVCKSYDVSDDVTEWVFHLDDRAVFHDGTPLTAHAVEWNLKGILEFQRPRAANILPVMNEDSIEVVDDYTLRIVLTTPFADLPWLLGYGGQTFIANPDEVMAHEVDGDKGEGWLLENAAGSGPFKITRWEPGTVYEIEAVPDYWRGWPEQGRLAGVIWRIIRDTAERRMALLALL